MIAGTVAVTLMAAGGVAAAVVVPMLDDARSSGETVGFEDGYDEGRSEGYNDGRADGYEDGLDTRSAPSDPSYPDTWYPVNVDTFLLVRSGPGTGFPEVGKVPAGEDVMVQCFTYGEPIEDDFGVLDDTWYRVRSPFSGYVSAAFVDTGLDYVDPC